MAAHEHAFCLRNVHCGKDGTAQRRARGGHGGRGSTGSDGSGAGGVGSDCCNCCDGCGFLRLRANWLPFGAPPFFLRGISCARQPIDAVETSMTGWMRMQERYRASAVGQLMFDRAAAGDMVARHRPYTSVLAAQGAQMTRQVAGGGTSRGYRLRGAGSSGPSSAHRETWPRSSTTAGSGFSLYGGWLLAR